MRHARHRRSGGGLRLAAAAMWLILQKGLWDAGLALQTDAAGWLAPWRGHPVQHGGMPTGGPCTRCR